MSYSFSEVLSDLNLINFVFNYFCKIFHLFMGWRFTVIIFSLQLDGIAFFAICCAVFFFTYNCNQKYLSAFQENYNTDDLKIFQKNKGILSVHFLLNMKCRGNGHMVLALDIRLHLNSRWNFLRKLKNSNNVKEKRRPNRPDNANEIYPRLGLTLYERNKLLLIQTKLTLTYTNSYYCDPVFR